MTVPVPLGAVMTKSDSWIDLDPHREYKEVTVRLWGKGVALRKLVTGSEIAGARRLRVRPGQFIASRIDARNGAFGLIPDELDGAVVTNDFPVFVANGELLLADYLGWLSRTRMFVESCSAASEGTTNRVRLKEDKFLRIAIRLPPLTEQRRIVARIERFAARIGEARKLMEQVTNQADILCRAILADSQREGLVPTAMSELVDYRQPNTRVSPDETYQFAGIYCFGRGAFVGAIRTGIEFAYKSLTQLRVDDFVYPKLMAWEGALAVVPPECEGLFVSPEYPVFSIRPDRVLPEVLDVHFRSPAVWPALSANSTGTNVRRRRLSPSDFLRYRFPLPSMAVQFQLRTVKSKVEAVKALQAQSAAELDALLPAVLDRAFKGVL